MINCLQYKLSDVADVKLSNVDKKTKEKERPIRLCNYTDVYKNDFIDFEKSQNFMVASCNDNEYKKFILRKGQVAITKDSEKRNDIGISTYISEDFEDVVLGYHLSLITPNRDKLSGRFLHYWLNTKQAKTYFENNAGGSGQRCTLTLDTIKSIPLHLPNLQTQKKIAKVLSDLDTKIELNNRINTQLEAMAKLLYDYWFVQFDFPNEAGKPYKSSGGEMVYSEVLKREVPLGWKVGTLEDIGKIITGKTPSKKTPEYFGSKIPFVTPTDFKNFDTIIIDSIRGISEAGIRNMPNYVIPSKSVIVTCIGSDMGKVAINSTSCMTNQQINSITIDNEYSLNEIYVYFYLKHIYKILRNIAVSSSTVPIINKSQFSSINIIIPQKKHLDIFYQKIYPLFEKIRVNTLENKELQSLRNWLLPMLMNGQVQVKETERAEVY